MAFLFSLLLLSVLVSHSMVVGYYIKLLTVCLFLVC